MTGQSGAAEGNNEPGFWADWEGDLNLVAGDVLEQRLHATAQWLSEHNGSVYSIQLLGTERSRTPKRLFQNDR